MVLQVGSLEGRGVIELENASLLSPSFPRKDAPFVKDSPIDHECQNFSQDVIRSKVLSSIKVVVFSTKINLLMPFGPLAILIDKLFHSHGWVFLFSLLGIIPLAERLGYTTEQLAFFTGPAVGGLLYATFGNATELIISIHALKSGLIRLVQQSLLGSILSNLLLVLGCALFAGGLVFHKREQVFNHADAAVDFGLLLMAVMGLLFPAVLHATHTEIEYGKSQLSLSRFTSCIMLVAYASYIVFQVKSQKNLQVPVDEDKSFNEDTSNDAEVPEISMWESMIWISILTGGISILSEYLVSTIEGASKEFQMPVAFLSVILLPLVGNAAEHVGSVMFAVKDKLDISLGVAVGSSIQISMFVIPLCVVVGWMIECPMDLNFQPFETTSLFMSVIIVAFMLHNGTSNYFKGMVLILCYLIVSASFYEHIDPMSIEDNPSIAGP
ncbi:vacuolar cation/proton exchanger 3-like isoform X2 [Cicer arietinum]|uniref:Vacuolar cation/proton exchanger n=1 Tax=Cicer arietinum TaxID=3827 RepID=A0A3Q7YFK6_CICAR|nr:vacuolar cation/proton exchanger 3-like isoform X2 [Cicer arietinum]